MRRTKTGIETGYLVAMATRRFRAEIPSGSRMERRRSFPSIEKKRMASAGGCSTDVSRIKKSGPSWATESVLPPISMCIFTSAEWPT